MVTFSRIIISVKKLFLNYKFYHFNIPSDKAQLEESPITPPKLLNGISKDFKSLEICRVLPYFIWILLTKAEIYKRD